MSSPAPALRVPLASIASSPTNPRRRFDEAKLAELADSIRRHDVLQPILLRPTPFAQAMTGPYELVAGERRFRAAQAAGLTDIPATVRELSDAEVLEIQVIENLQRADLTPLEEALGYDRLLKCQPRGVDVPGGKYTVEDIAGKVGRSKAYVYAKLKLLALCPEARKALEDGKLSESVALLVARIPVHDLQRKAAKGVTEVRWEGAEPMSYRQAVDYIQRDFMLRLEQAPFDVTRIYFVDGKSAKPIATACGECPKRTGNQPELFADVKSADVCTDPVCFDKKREAQRLIEREAKIAEGYKVLTGKAAEKLLPNEWGPPADGYVRLDDRHPRDGRNRTYRQILGKEAPKGTLVEFEDRYSDGHVKVVELAKLEDLKPLLKGKLAKAGEASSAGQREEKKSPEEAFEDRLHREIFAKLPSSPSDFTFADWMLFAEQSLMSADLRAGDIADHFAPRKDGKKHDWRSGEEALKKALPKLDIGDVARIALAGVIASSCYTKTALLEAAKRYHVDPAKVKKAIADEEKAAAQEKKPAKAKATPKQKARAPLPGRRSSNAKADL